MTSVHREAPTAGRTPWRIAGYSAEGRPIEYAVLGDGELAVLVMAAIHGSEPAGVPLVAALAEYLEANPHLLNGRRVILLPRANPDGLAAGRRGNVRRVDVNRNFPAGNFEHSAGHGAEARSEPETCALLWMLETLRPERIITIHQPLDCLDYDGPAGDLAAAMADCCPLPVHKLGALPGSLGSFAGEELGIAVVTMELPRSASRSSPDRLWDDYGAALLAGIRYPEAVEWP